LTLSVISNINKIGTNNIRVLLGLIGRLDSQQSLVHCIAQVGDDNQFPGIGEFLFHSRLLCSGTARERAAVGHRARAAPANTPSKPAESSIKKTDHVSHQGISRMQLLILPK